MGEKKICWITDIVHGSFSISALEKRLIATTVFNRLHNVLQSSTVFYTYPCGRTSRFSHSLGAMHVAGKLLRSGLLNATEGNRGRFFGIARQIIDGVDNRIKDGRINFSGSPNELRKYSLSELAIDPFYPTQTLPDLGPEEAYIFTLLLQAVRIAALFHDVGHPPFSHVIERSLSRIFAAVRKKKALSENEEAFLKLYDQRTEVPFHESLSVEIAEKLLQKEIEGSARKEKLAYDYARIKFLTLGILLGKEPFYKALHDIVASDLDADRLDYVPRDLVMSGFSKAPLRTNRLIASYQMVFTRGNKFAFLPSVRALSSIEEFFQKRFDLYKFVSYHHRVVKCDALLEQSVVDLAGDLLANPNPFAKPDDYLLREDISGLWQILDPDLGAFDDKRGRYYTQWDDSWLLAILRRAYFQLAKDESENKRAADDEKSLLRAQLEELLANSKSYYSLFKRGDTFQEVDHAFLRALKPNFNWHLLKDKLPKASRARVDQLEQYHAAFSHGRRQPQDSTLDLLVEENGFFLGALLRLIVHARERGEDTTAFVQAAVQDLKRKGLHDALLIPKEIKPGVTADFELINRNGKIIHLGRVSKIAKELFRAASFCPPFFIFIYAKSAPTEEHIIRLRQQFGAFLAKRFKEWTENTKK